MANARKMLLGLGVVLAVGLAGCMDGAPSLTLWRSHTLTSPVTGAEVSCVAPRRDLTAEEAQSLHQCIAACEAKGYRLVDPAGVPPAPPGPAAAGAPPPSIPRACQAGQ